jgi:hypothetical protein
MKVTRELIEKNLLDLAKTAKRESDQLRAWEDLAKMGGHMKDQTTVITGLFTQLNTNKDVK